MSVALILKNTILVILIILIGHFMVKNVLLDRSSSSKPHTASSKVSLDPVLGTLIPIKGELAPSPIVPESETPIAKPASDAVAKVQGGLDKAKEELLRFIDDEEDDVEKYFNKDSSLSPTQTDNCKDKTPSAMFPLSTTCDPSIQDLSRVDKSVKTASHACLDQDKKNVMLLNEYENESTMNGGQLFGGLSAYDAFDNNFQAYSCQ